MTLAYQPKSWPGAIALWLVTSSFSINTGFSDLERSQHVKLKMKWWKWKCSVLFIQEKNRKTVITSPTMLLVSTETSSFFFSSSSLSTLIYSTSLKTETMSVLSIKWTSAVLSHFRSWYSFNQSLIKGCHCHWNRQRWSPFHLF